MKNGPAQQVDDVNERLGQTPPASDRRREPRDGRRRRGDRRDRRAGRQEVIPRRCPAGRPRREQASPPVRISAWRPQRPPLTRARARKVSTQTSRSRINTPIAAGCRPLAPTAKDKHTTRDHRIGYPVDAREPMCRKALRASAPFRPHRRCRFLLDRLQDGAWGGRPRRVFVDDGYVDRRRSFRKRAGGRRCIGHLDIAPRQIELALFMCRRRYARRC
jgi:hypothetical protein